MNNTPSIEVTEAALGTALAHRLLRQIDSAIVTRGIVDLTVTAKAKTPLHANAKHAADAVLRVAQLQSVANWMNAQASERLAKLEEEIDSEVTKAWPLKEEKLSKLFASIAKRINNAFSALAETFSAHCDELAQAVADKTSKRLEKHHSAKVAHVTAPSSESVTVLGATLREHFDKLAHDAVFKFKAAVRQGIANQDTLAEMLERLGGTDEAVKAGDVPGHEFHGNQWESARNNAARLSDVAKAHSDKNHKAVMEEGQMSPILSQETATAHHNAANAWKEARSQRVASGQGKKGDSVDRHFMQREKFHREIAHKNEKSRDELNKFWKRIESNEHNEAHDFSATDSVHGASSSSAAEIRIRLMDAVENSVNKVIENAVAAFSHEASTAAGEGLDESETRMGWEWVAVHDDKCCDQCEFYDGNRWTQDFAPVEDAPEYPDDPPLHFNCRCTLVPSDLNEEPTGEVDFEDYLSQFSRSEQEAAFGKAALRAYHRGDITANQLVGQKSNLLSLQAFKEAE